MLHPRRKTMHSYFYPRSPRGERQSWTDACASFDLFLSTLPARGATYDYGNNTAQFLFLSTLPARGATLFSGRQGVGYGQFLSTLPARGATRFAVAAWYMFPRFLSTLPARGATIALTLMPLMPVDFYPRSPRGERRLRAGGNEQSLKFLSTLPARGAT